MNTQQTSRPNVPGAQLTAPSLALMGYAGAGKDTVAQVVQALYPYYARVAFADVLKDVATTIWGPDAVRNRGYLQDLGVKVREIDEDAWVRAALRTAPPEPIVITDVRFPNEVRECVARGFVTARVVASREVRLNRLKANGKLQDESQLDHISEKALDGYSPDYVIVNEDVDLSELGQRASAIIEYERGRRG